LSIEGSVNLNLKGTPTSEKTIIPSWRRHDEDMTVRNIAAETQRNYIRPAALTSCRRPGHADCWLAGERAKPPRKPADIAVASGAENAEGCYREALALAEPHGMRPQVGHCHFGLGKLRPRRGDREQAQDHLTTAMAMYLEMGMTYWLDQVEAELRQLG